MSIFVCGWKERLKRKKKRRREEILGRGYDTDCWELPRSPRFIMKDGRERNCLFFMIIYLRKPFIFYLFIKLPFLTYAYSGGL